MKKVLSLFLILSSLNIFSQIKYTQNEYCPSPNKLLEISEFVWYGFDFSNCLITSPSKPYEGRMVKEKHIPEWISALNKEFEPISFIQKFNDEIKDKVDRKIQSDFGSVEQMCLDIDDKKIISTNNKLFNIDSLKEIISSYQLPQKEGYGIVYVVENINEQSIEPKDQFASGYLVVFNISDREILYANKTFDEPGSPFGWTSYWKTALIKAVNHSLTRYFLFCNNTLKLNKKKG